MTEPKRGQAEAKRPLIRVSRPIYDWLVELTAERGQLLNRDVSFTEVLEWLRSQVTP
jgi:hypothetical protein